MHQLARAVVQGVAIDPAAGRSGRVETLEGQGVFASAQTALLHVAHLFGAIELIQLLEPEQPHIPAGHFQGFELAGVIQAKEEDLLSGRPIDTFHRADSTPEVPAQAQGVDGPADLGVDAGSQGLVHPAQHHRVAVWTAQQLQHQFHADVAGLCRTAATLGQQLIHLPRLDLPVDIKEGGRDQLRQFTGRQRSAPPRRYLRGTCHSTRSCTSD